MTVDPRELFYDGTTGLMTRAKFTNGAYQDEVTYYHDSMGRATKHTDWTGGNGFRYAFDVAGRLTQMTDYDDST